MGMRHRTAPHAPLHAIRYDKDIISMHRSLSLFAAGLGLAALVPTLAVAHAASSGYTTLKHAGYDTAYRSTWAVKDLPGRTVFHDRDAALFPTVTAFVSPDGNASVILGARRGRDSAAQVGTIERVALSTTHAGYHTVKGYAQTTTQIAARTYTVAGITFASSSDRVSELVYATSMGGRTFYFFVAVDGKASSQEARDAGVIVGATQAR